MEKSNLKKSKKNKRKYECIERSKLTDNYRFPKRKIKKRTVSMLLRNIPADVRARFKAWCDTRGYTMVGKLRDHMLACIRGETDDL